MYSRRSYSVWVFYIHKVIKSYYANKYQELSNKNVIKLSLENLQILKKKSELIL